MNENGDIYDRVLPHLRELFIDERNGRFLLLNPRGPRWLVGSKLVAAFVCTSGGKTIRETYETLTSQFRELTHGQINTIAESLLGSGFFDDGEKRAILPVSNVAFNLTKRCNLRCPYCYCDSVSADSQHHQHELCAAEWQRVASEVLQINPQARLFISGGEPLLRIDLMEILREVSRLGFHQITLVTNGTLIDSSMVTELSELPNVFVQVSIDSILPDENERTRGAGSLQLALTAVQSMKRANVPVTVSATLTQLNKKSIWRLKQYFADRGIRARTSVFFLVGERSKQSDNWLGLTADETWEALVHNSSHLKGTLPNDFSKSLEPGDQRYSCGVGYGTLVVNEDGSVFPCNHLPGDKFLLGNVRNTPLKDIAAKGFERFAVVDVDQMAELECAGCHLRYICSGGCKASAFNAYGSLRSVPKECDWFKRIWLEALWVDVMGLAYSSFASPGITFD